MLFRNKEESNYVVFRIWIEVEIIMLSEIGQTEEDACPIFSLIYGIYT
jgi:hypothetical protein